VIQKHEENFIFYIVSLLQFSHGLLRGEMLWGGDEGMAPSSLATTDGAPHAE
jgi:hypothetical protein